MRDKEATRKTILDVGKKMFILKRILELLRGLDEKYFTHFLFVDDCVVG